MSREERLFTEGRRKMKLNAVSGMRACVSVKTKLINNHGVVYTTLVCMHRGVNYGGRRREIVDGVNGTRIEKSMRVQCVSPTEATGHQTT